MILDFLKESGGNTGCRQRGLEMTTGEIEKQCWYRKRVSNQKTKNEPVVRQKSISWGKTSLRSKADTLVMDRQDEGSEDLWRQR